MAETPIPGRRLLSVEEAAERLAVSKHTLYRRIQTGELDARRVGSHGAIRISAEALEALLKPAHREEP
jgi:excisionase family DNA binding protein